MLDDLRQYRQKLHQIPELGYEEYKTKAYLLTQLQQYKCKIHEVSQTGLIAYFDHGKEQTIAFRADMDGLPIGEQTNLPFSSTHQGNMHACGHDGHMAIVLTLAKFIDSFAQQMKYNICLIFQQAEEREAGARLIVSSGILQQYNVGQIYGLHLWPGLEKGQLYTKAGELMSKGSELNITINGKSAHVANWEAGIDTIHIASLLITKIYEMEAALPHNMKRLLKIGAFHGGTARNIICDKIVLQGSVRSFDDQIHQMLKGMIQLVANTLMDQFDCFINITYQEGYEAVINDKALFSHITKSFPSINELAAPVMHSEDFGLYRNVCPTLFFFLGIGDTFPLHHPQFDFDTDVLEVGYELFKDILFI